MTKYPKIYQKYKKYDYLFWAIIVLIYKQRFNFYYLKSDGRADPSYLSFSYAIK